MLTVGKNNEKTRVDWLQRTLGQLPAGLRMLDAGAGEQQFKKFCGHLNYVSQDFAQYDPQQVPQGLQMPRWDYGKLDIVSDITAIPQPDQSFDAIMCIEVLEHLPEPVQALHEFTRLLRPRGHLILTAPFCSLTHFAPYHFATGFSRYFYEHHLQADYEILEMTPNGNFFEFLAQELLRLPEMAKRYADGPLPPSEYAALGQVLEFLQRCTQKDQKSAELLNFGYHVHALKR